ncbi:prolipoprotein diacylglyceryl transferase family protein, partial [Acinetobacter baumannii]
MTAWVVDINPVALSLGPVAVRWYGLAYGAGFLIGLWWLQRLWRDDPRLPSGFQPDDFLTWAVIGVVAGGR